MTFALTVMSELQRIRLGIVVGSRFVPQCLLIIAASSAYSIWEILGPDTLFMTGKPFLTESHISVAQIGRMKQQFRRHGLLWRGGDFPAASTQFVALRFTFHAAACNHICRISESTRVGESADVMGKTMSSKKAHDH